MVFSFKRHITESLEDWKFSENRKPLILRGARQVGKTTLVRQFSYSYKNSILLNLEKKKDLKYFEQYEDVHSILEALFIANNIASKDKKHTLLFIDEIQESPKAIQLLRYFYEEIPELHVISAGSLLEFAMQKIKSFPVGRVEYVYLYPMNFAEYLLANDYLIGLEQLNQIPVNVNAHDVLMNMFHRYGIIGGMPEVIKTYLKTESLSDLPKVYESIWGTYKDDVEKYTSNRTERNVIKHIMANAHLYLDERIKFQGFANSNYRSREVGEAFRNLDDAKVIQLIYPTTNLEVPVKPDIKKSPRMQFLDTGLVNHTLNIQGKMLAMDDLSSSFKGAIIPHLITQELISLNTYNSKKPNFWVREKRQSSAEVDLVYTYEDKVIPIEIKSGATGSLKSLHQFIERSKHPYAIRIFGGKFSVQESKTPAGTPYLLMNLPYYLGTKIPEYVEYFVENYSLGGNGLMSQ
ncbi:MAG: AAA family ATPase [Bacteroidota bacterium]